jgi:hypothetical protein
MQRTTTINKSNMSGASSNHQQRLTVSVPPITTGLKAYYFTDGEVMMDCILPTSWDVRTRGVQTAGVMSIDKVSIEQAKCSSFNQSKVFHSVKRLIMKYTLNPMLSLPRSHPVYVYDDRMAVQVKEIYERVKTDIVEYHCSSSPQKEGEEPKLTFPTIKEEERFRFICKYFVSRCVLTMKMFQEILAATELVTEPEELVYEDLLSRDPLLLLKKNQQVSSEDDMEYPQLHCFIPCAMRHARIAIVSKLEAALPRFMTSLVIHPMPMPTTAATTMIESLPGIFHDQTSLVKKFTFFSSQGLLFPVTFASSAAMEETSITVMLTPLAGKKHHREMNHHSNDDDGNDRSSKKAIFSSSEDSDDDEDCVVLFEQSDREFVSKRPIVLVC